MAELGVHRRWRDDPGLLTAVRGLFSYGPGDDRATGYLYADDGPDWPPALADMGPSLLAALDELVGVRFTHLAFQAYRNGTGCDWHTDDAWDVQAVLSLGATRTFGARRTAGGEPRWLSLHDGDLVVMPSGFQQEWQHCVPVEDVTGERCSLVFRTPVRG